MKKILYFWKWLCGDGRNTVKAQVQVLRQEPVLLISTWAWHPVVFQSWTSAVLKVRKPTSGMSSHQIVLISVFPAHFLFLLLFYTCVLNYFLFFCRPCECDLSGSVGDCSALDGRCYCKQNVEGQNCNRLVIVLLFVSQIKNKQANCKGLLQ